MFQFADLVRGSEMVREVKLKFPETNAVFEKFGLCASCIDCSIEMAARRAGASLDDLMVEVNKAIYKSRGVTA